MTSSSIEAKLAQWRAELLSLTRANPLVNFNPRRRMLTLTHPTPEAIFDGLVNRGRTFTFYRPPEVPLDQEPEAAPGPEQWPLLFPVEEAANGLPILPVESPVEASATEPVAGGEQPFLGEPSVPAASVPTPQPKASEIVVAGDPKKSEALLYRLRLRSRAALQEQGINVLFVAFGVLDWRETPTSQERLVSPLLLVPVQLERETALKPYQIQVLDDPVLNPALVRKLTTDFNLPLALPDDEILDFSLIPLLDYLRAAIAGQVDWVVREEAYLGLFSFANYAMYADLEANRERFAAHPVIRFLGGEPDVLPPPAVQPPSADQLDASCAPADTFQVLDADASQQETIAAVKAGLNLIVQGPPGTGKSQTITNIIAEMLAAEKTVLFVSEKKDALKVVARRLREVGLGDFCLEAHEQGLDKGAVIKNLASTLQAGNGVHPDPNAAYKLAQTAQMRRQLNEYVSALHDAQNPLGRSAFQIHGELAARATIPIVTFTLPEIGALTPERLATLTDAVQHLVRVGDVLQGADTHPWRDTTLTAYNPQIRAELTECLKHLTENASELVTVQETIDAVWGLPKCATLTRARWLHELLALADERMTVPADWFRSSSLQPLLTTAADHHRQSDDYHRRRAALLARYTAALFSLDLPTIRQALATSGLPQTERITGMGTPGDRALTRQERISAAVRRALDCLASVARTSEIVAERLGLPIPKTLARAREVARVAALVLTNPRPLPEWFEIQQRIMIEQLAQDAGARRATVTTDRPPLEQRFTPEFFILATEERKERFADKYASWLRALRPSYHRELRELRQCLREPGELDYADALACLTQARRVAAAEDWLSDQQSALAAGFGWHFAGAQTDWPAVSQALASMRELYVLLGQRGWPPALKGVLLGENGGPVALRPAVHDLDAAINAVESAWGDLATSMSVQNLPFSGAGLDDYLLFPLHDWLRDWLAAVQPLWEADRALRECRKDSSAILPVADLLADACEAAAVCELEQSLMMGAEALRASFGTLFSGLETNWQTVLDALQWVGRMRDHFSGPPPESFVAALLADRQTPLAERARLATLIAATSEQVERLRSWFTAEGLLIDTDAPDDAALDVIAVWATEKLAAIPLLEEWLHYCQALRAAEAVGLVPFVERIRRAGLPPVDWPAIFLKQVHTLWLTWRYEQAPALEHFRWREHEAVVREFANLDRWQYQTAVRRITERLVARRPAVPYAPPRMSEPGILLHEAGKRRRFLPPRKLFAQLPNLLPALKPCLLMSPPTVAQFLGESALEFDLVIFDEASQIMPADAIGAIGRGKQVVVVGDRQQLPPMNFFNAPLDDSDPDEEMPESILDACAAAGLPERRLLWHYRSRREELIAFSNRYYYDGRLITFPSLTDQPPALEFILVEQGRYDRAGSRANRAEARRIADLVIAHVRQRPHQSLGVITFSETQHEAIEYELDRRKRADPTLEPLLRQSDDDSDSFFIRSLEHVQGDERDVIFFSVGYGPDQAGKLSLNFGPLNRQGGERRLNVAVTRARDHIKILASFHPHDLDLTRTSSDGVRLLRRYLEYADQGPRALLGEITSEGGDFESPFEASVAAALTARGLRVVSQVGVSGYRIDLGIKDDQADRYLLGVECDGATYHSAKTARDRDRLRQQVLENLGWHIHRVWSTDWIKDPARETARILAALERARSAPSQPAPVREESPPAPDPPPAPVPSPATEEAPPRAEIAIAAPYRAAQLPPQGDIEQFRSAHSLDLAQLVRAVVAVESPVHQDRVMRAVASSFGITRLGNQVRAQLERAIAAAVRANFATRRGEFLWSPGMTTPQVREDGGRAIGEMPPEELAAGIVALLDAAFSLPRDELITAAARAFGYDRTGNHVGAGFARALDALLAVGTLTEVGGQICLNR